MAYNLEPRTIKENLLGLIGKNPHAEPRPANTREECFLADIAENGGGGGGLPPYTSADKGKGLTLGEGEGTEEKDIISPQTVTLDGNGEPAVLPVGSYDFSEVTDGDTLTFTLNGVATQITAASGYGYDFIYNHESGTDTVQIAYSAEQGCGFNYLRRSGDVASQLAGDYQISISKTVPSVEPKWEAASCVINVSGNPGSTLTPDKTYSEVVEAINKGIIPVAVLGGGSLILQYSGKSGDTLNFQCLTANTSVGGTIEGLACFSGAYSEADGFTVAHYTVSF